MNRAEQIVHALANDDEPLALALVNSMRVADVRRTLNPPEDTSGGGES